MFLNFEKVKTVSCVFSPFPGSLEECEPIYVLGPTQEGTEEPTDIASVIDPWVPRCLG